MLLFWKLALTKSNNLERLVRLNLRAKPGSAKAIVTFSQIVKLADSGVVFGPFRSWYSVCEDSVNHQISAIWDYAIAKACNLAESPAELDRLYNLTYDYDSQNNAVDILEKMLINFDSNAIHLPEMAKLLYILDTRPETRRIIIDWFMTNYKEPDVIIQEMISRLVPDEIFSSTPQTKKPPLVCTEMIDRLESSYPETGTIELIRAGVITKRSEQLIDSIIIGGDNLALSFDDYYMLYSNPEFCDEILEAVLAEMLRVANSEDEIKFIVDQSKLRSFDTILEVAVEKLATMHESHAKRIRESYAS